MVSTFSILNYGPQRRYKCHKTLSCHFFGVIQQFDSTNCFIHNYLTVMKSGVIHIHQNVKCLFTLQKKAIRLICNADRLAHTNAMFKDMSILKLSEFVKYKTAIVMFSIFHGTLPIQLQRRFSKYSSVYSTRQTKSFVMVQVRTNLKAMCLSVHSVKLWNTLPDDIKNCTSVNIFKKCLKKHFLSHY